MRANREIKDHPHHLTALLAAVLFAALALSACGEEPWRTRDITGAMPPLEFELTSEDGRTVTAADFQGKVVLLFFGFTHCPDVCPTTLAYLNSVIEELDNPDQVRVLFVTVDPERDTPEHLRRYTDAFGPHIVGLHGERQAIDALTSRYGVAYKLGEPEADGSYSVSHTSAIFAFDREGDIRLMFRESTPAADATADLRRLLREG